MCTFNVSSYVWSNSALICLFDERESWKLIVGCRINLFWKLCFSAQMYPVIPKIKQSEEKHNLKFVEKVQCLYPKHKGRRPKLIWNFSQNSSDFENPGFPKQLHGLGSPLKNRTSRIFLNIFPQRKENFSQIYIIWYIPYHHSSRRNINNKAFVSLPFKLVYGLCTSTSFTSHQNSHQNSHLNSHHVGEKL